MKRIIILSITILFNLYVFPQTNTDTKQNKENKFQFILNDTLVSEYLDEFVAEARKHDIDIEKGLKDLKYVLIEKRLKNPEDRKLTGFNLAKIDKDRKLILLSRDCLLDRYILKATLFRELSHYLGLLYNLDRCEIMRVNKPKGYSYAWFDDDDIRKIIYNQLFSEIKKL